MSAAVRELSPQDRFLYWIQERESIRLQRKAGCPKPWTNDPILQSYRFCNVRRIDDKVSQWLLENWYKPYFGHPYMLLACCLARFFNLPESLEAIGFPEKWEPSKIKRILRERQRRGLKIFNGAYMVRGNDGKDKVASVIDHTLDPLSKDPPRIDTNSMQASVEELALWYGFGTFMAGQVIADMRWAVPGKWKDKRRWAAPGPGSTRGINRFFSRPITTALQPSQFQDRLAFITGVAKAELPKALTRRLEAHDWQNCLCEWDTYERVLWNQGRKKQLYPGV